MIATLRANLAAIQREPMHARIGEVIGTRVDPKTKRERTVRRSSLAVCPRCPSRKACRVASVRLAEAETRMLSGGANAK